jgi:hypothetical protein
MSFEETKQKAKSIGKKILIMATIASVILFGMYYIWRTYTFSEGTRTGTLVKISKKGYVFKTFEGQIQLGGVEIVNKQSMFEFSVDNEETYNKAQLLEGKNVRVHYNELNDAFFWQGDTDYIVYDVEEVKNGPR